MYFPCEVKGFFMENGLTLSKYMYETFAIGATNQLPISSVCNAKCLFCSNNMNPFPILREGFRPLKDVKKGIAVLDPNNTAEIRVGDSLPGRISEGEALLHPDLFEILKLIREKAPNRVIQMNTNGTVLTQDFVEKLVPFKPIKFTISYHSDKQENWSKVFSLNKEKYSIARNSFFLLKSKEFIVEAAMVPLPTLFGYDDIENTIKNLRCYTNHVIIYAPGFSKLASPKLAKILDVDYEELSEFLTKMRKKYKFSLDFTSDPLKPINFFPFDFMVRSFNNKFKNVLWLFSEAAYDRAKKILDGYNPYIPNSHYGVVVQNKTYAGNINVAGLLMVKDFDKAINKALKDLAKQDIKIDLLVLPRVAFDRYGDDLMEDNYSILSEKYNIPVWVG